MKAPLTRFAYVVAALVVASYAFMTLRGPGGIAAYLDKEREIKSLEKRNGDLNKDIERAAERINRLKKDPEARERAARERLSVVDKRDKVYVTGDAAPPKPAGK
jgi:cell division protein FtsB